MLGGKRREDLELKADSPNIPPTIRPLVISTRLGCMEHFRGGLLRTVYPDGAIVRDGLEIDCSDEIGRLEIGTVVYASERRVNSCDIARFLIEYELPVSQGSGTVQGWVSERIRGGDEALIMEKVRPDDPSCLYVADGNETPSSLAGAAASEEGHSRRRRQGGQSLRRRRGFMRSYTSDRAPMGASLETRRTMGPRRGYKKCSGSTSLCCLHCDGNSRCVA